MSNKIDSEGHQHLDTDRARGGTAPGQVRYVLIISMVLVIVIFAGLLIYGRF